jgi:hypothetical protein
LLEGVSTHNRPKSTAYNNLGLGQYAAEERYMARGSVIMLSLVSRFGALGCTTGRAADLGGHAPPPPRLNIYSHRASMGAGPGRMDPSGVALDTDAYVRHEHLTDNAAHLGVNLRF